MSSNRDSSQLKAGDVLTGERTFSQEEIADFCRITRDKNPLYSDEEFCSRTRFGHTIVPGLLVASIFADIASKWDLFAREISFEFVAPVSAGERVSAAISITYREGHRLRADFECRTRERGVVLRGSIKGMSFTAIMLGDNQP